MADAETDVHLNPLKILHEVEKIMPENAIIIADGGDFVGSAAYIVKPRGPLQWLDPGAFGTLGVGGGFALGAKLCNPEKTVWILYGDGSFGYSVAEIETYTRCNAPVVAVIGNDACWSQIAREQLPMFGSNVGCGLQVGCPSPPLPLYPFFFVLSDPDPRGERRGGVLAEICIRCCGSERPRFQGGGDGSSLRFAYVVVAKSDPDSRREQMGMGLN